MAGGIYITSANVATVGAAFESPGGKRYTSAMSDERIPLGISTCLLGENVRYNGGHKLDRYLKDTLGRFVRWIPVCPEVECGLGVPRESMRLVGDTAEPRLMTTKTGIDHTERMQRWADDRLARITEDDMCGFVFKSASPSSGLHGVRVYNDKGIPSRRGVGMFARAFTRRFPLLPVEDDGRLNDPGIRENFIERVFVYWRWRQFVRADGSRGGLVGFHTDHKLLIMAHDPRAVSALGSMVAHVADRGRGAAAMAAVKEEYLAALMRSLALEATVKKNVNVLQHAIGYFKKNLAADEKVELLEVIGDYQRGHVPLVVPIVLIRHFVRRFAEPYLSRQIWLNPHPVELCLRNHA
jgi:uncharacterized protein YbgA (DUF1722 family)/uncharacterized protein YbbK (DUF523 family)